METQSVLTTLGDDPHTQGLFRIRRMVKDAGIVCHILPPGAKDEAIFALIQRHDPEFLGLSYRLSPEVGVKEFRRILGRLHQEGLLQRPKGRGFRKVALAGLPETMRAMQAIHKDLPCPIATMEQDNDRMRGASRVLDFFAIHGAVRISILERLQGEWFPPRQRYFGHPKEFAERKNDGGVPYQTFADLVALAEAAQVGNFPSLKPYAHVVDLVPFIDTCLKAGMLVGAHQAVPLYWFNELDGRGPMTIPASIHEHIEAIRTLARRGIPTEMNDPNQWSSRWAHDTVFCSDYALISAVMTQAGSKDLVLQMQFNKPRETSDFADLAKMTAGLELAERIIADAPQGKQGTLIWRETRTGIDSLDPDPSIAKFQLARSTLLQMMVQPPIIHQVSSCEADHIATADDVIDSSKLVRRAIRVFQAHQAELLPLLRDPRILERKAFLLSESEYLLRQIARLSSNPLPAPSSPSEVPLGSLGRHLADPTALIRAIEQGYMAASGIFHPRYQVKHFVTGPGPTGGLDCFHPLTFEGMDEKERLSLLS